MSDDIWLYGSLVYFHWPDALHGATLDNDVTHFALVITPIFCLHHVEGKDEDPVSGSLYADYMS